MGNFSNDASGSHQDGNCDNHASSSSGDSNHGNDTSGSNHGNKASGSNHGNKASGSNHGNGNHEDSYEGNYGNRASSSHKYLAGEPEEEEEEEVEAPTSQGLSRFSLLFNCLLQSPVSSVLDFIHSP